MKSWLQAILWGLCLAVIMLSYASGIYLFALVALVPIIVLYVRLALPWFLVTVLAAWAVAVGIAGWGSFMLIPGLICLASGIAVGHQYRRESNAKSAMAAGISVFFISELLVLIVSYALGTNIPDEFSRSLSELFAESGVAAMFSKDVLDGIVRMYVQMIPLVMILFAASITGLGHTLARRILNRAGYKIARFKPMREWMFPRSIVWYYLIALGLDLLFTWDPSSTMGMILTNLIPLFTLLFYLQGISFLYFVAYVKRWPPALPIIGIVLFPLLLNLISILGVFDAAFPIRERFRKP